MPTRRWMYCIVLVACLQFAGLAGMLYAQSPQAARPPVSQATAQNAIPAGTVIPAVLPHTLDSSKIKVGQPIVLEVAQDVPLENGEVIRRRSKLTGGIVQVASTPTQDTLVLRLDRLEYKHAEVPIATQLRAIASSFAVGQSQLPSATPVGHPPSPATWTTTQIGGDTVYRGGGPVVSAEGQKVGTPTPCVVVEQCGVLDQVPATAGRKCLGAPADDAHAQAMWVFSADACGVYDFEDLQFRNGSTMAQSNAGQIVFTAEEHVKLSGGTGLLLVVTGPAQSAGEQ